MRFQENQSSCIEKLNQQLSRLLLGLRGCINQPELSSYLIQLIQLIREVANDHSTNQLLSFDKEKQSLIQKVYELERKNEQLIQEYEFKLMEQDNQFKINLYKNELEQYQRSNEKQIMKQERKKQKQTPQREELKNNIKNMQEKIQTLSEKEKKLIQLVKAVKGRGIDIEYIYKNMDGIECDDEQQQNSNTNKKKEQMNYEYSSHSEFADMSAISNGGAMIKRNKQYLLD